MKDRIIVKRQVIQALIILTVMHLDGKIFMYLGKWGLGVLYFFLIWEKNGLNLFVDSSEGRHEIYIYFFVSSE